MHFIKNVFYRVNKKWLTNKRLGNVASVWDVNLVRLQMWYTLIQTSPYLCVINAACKGKKAAFVPYANRVTTTMTTTPGWLNVPNAEVGFTENATGSTPRSTKSLVIYPTTWITCASKLSLRIRKYFVLSRNFLYCSWKIAKMVKKKLKKAPTGLFAILQKT